MINEQGGSSHDPAAVLPPDMWSRPVRRTPVKCRMCTAASTGPRDSPMWEVPRATFSHEAAARLDEKVRSGELGPLALVCQHCDGFRGPRV